MSVNDNRLTVTFRWFTDTLNRNSNFQGNTSTSTCFMQGDFVPVLCPIVEGGKSRVAATIVVTRGQSNCNFCAASNFQPSLAVAVK